MAGGSSIALSTCLCGMCECAMLSTNVGELSRQLHPGATHNDNMNGPAEALEAQSTHASSIMKQTYSFLP